MFIYTYYINVFIYTYYINVFIYTYYINVMFFFIYIILYLLVYVLPFDYCGNLTTAHPVTWRGTAGSLTLSVSSGR